jgi:hypothetical protein
MILLIIKIEEISMNPTIRTEKMVIIPIFQMTIEIKKWDNKKIQAISKTS